MVEDRIMRATSAGIALLWLGLVAANARARDLDDLQGAWDMAGLMVTRRPDFKQENLALRLTITGNQIEIRAKGAADAKYMTTFFGTDLVRATFRLDNPRAGPKSLVLTRVTSSKGQANRQVTQYGIYELSYGRLMVYLTVAGDPAPRSFSHQPKLEYLWVSGTRADTKAVAGKDKGNDKGSSAFKCEHRGFNGRAAWRGPASCRLCTFPRKNHDKGAPLNANDTRDPLVGHWSWFDGGTVTVLPGGTLVHDKGNRGTWNIKDRAQRTYTLRWLQGGFVDTIQLSEDGQSLSGSNQNGTAVSARKVTEGRARPKS
jgi:uncharacterized protein (TIGR03067 family)